MDVLDRRPTPETGNWQEPVILRDILAEMDDEKIRALLDACTPPTTGLGPWIEESTDLVGIEDDEPETEPEPDPQPVDKPVDEEPAA